MKNKKKAFTLMELLVVVIVLGVLGAVAAPKLSRVLETRKTAEAEEMLSALRTEQEKRCVLGKNYTADAAKVPVVAAASRSKNYTYSLKETGAEASRAEYTLKMPSYKDGRICCEGEGCGKLNKNYIACADILVDDECSADIPCNDCSCSAYAQANACECSPSTATCCSGLQEWDPVTKTCQDPPCTDCSCAAYAAEHACECAPSTETCCTGGQVWNETSKKCETPCTDCSCAAYAAEHACECAPSTETCCTAGQVWNDAAKRCEDACQDSYTYIGSADETEADTCDGDQSGKYTCSGGFKGACTDVYEDSLRFQAFSSRVTDSFFGLPEGLLLAANTGQCAGKVYCGGTQTMACCCPKGYYCDMSERLSSKYGCGLCKEGEGPGDLIEFDEIERVCPDGEYWDKEKKDCIKMYVEEVATARFKRKVVCCGS